ncbi:flagellar filament capping protein FliD [Dissulfurirhabdus thermomarina]|uniref:Flagellar hook-associated protein 2 n=1 Tax=Dissulfurirhabdus thermomarina TaxID=1765737 RepID=A0A6N9TN55_DISTH|nr:flagellar filament capping protein FliD [Dissulfurirhabdus thermomarina]NDY42569.1 flagellar filament capping protein FliD [Dissulfurirhabdus thermomarina]NMX23178.1 flagellar filament capping protein FliD [Dissulfurirhabdus thermomarina]
MAGTITSLGIGSGIDLQGVLDKLKAADQVPITGMRTRKLQYEDQLVEFRKVNSQLLTVKNLALELTLEGTFGAKSVTSSQAEVLGASADETASAGSHTVTVSRLAKRNSWQSSGVASATTSVVTASGSFTYTVDGTQTTLTLTPGMTLQQLADAINDDEDNPGVTATVMDDGTGSGTAYHLVLTSDETGEDNAITIDTNGSTLTLSEVQAAGTLDALVTIDGITYQRGTNTISDVIAGVTLTLQGEGTSTVRVTADTDTVKSKIMGLVDAYNDVVQEISANSGYDFDTGIGGSLNGVGVFRDVVSDINQTLVSPIEGLGGAYDSFGAIGLTFNRNGTVTVDEATLDAALASNLDDVKKLFVGEGDVDGLAVALNDRLRDITKPSGGLIASEIDRVQSAVDRLEEDIAQATERLDRRYETLARQFAQMDEIMAELQSQGTYLATQFESLNSLWSGK